jgi:HEAT repeat protein
MVDEVLTDSKFPDRGLRGTLAAFRRPGTQQSIGNLLFCPRTGHLRRGRVLVASLAVLAALVANLPAQDPEQVLHAVERDFQRLSNRFDPESVKKADRTLSQLGVLRYSPEPVRLKACAFLQQVARQRGPVAIFRIRVTAVNLLVDISSDRASLQFLLDLARRRGDKSLFGLDFFIERALARLQGGDQVRYLVEHLDDSREAIVRLCVGALARLKSDDLVLLALPKVPWITDLAISAEPEVRMRAVRLLGRLPDQRALKPLFMASTAKESGVRLAAATALKSKVDRPGVSLILSKLLVDPLPRIREAAARSFAAWPDLEPVSLLVSRIEKEPLRIRHAIGDALDRITGQDFGIDSVLWRNWLKSRSAASSTSRPTRRDQRPRYAPRYYGIPILSDRIVFILDISGSMDFASGKKGTPTRLDTARNELIAVLEQLRSSTRFNIVTFSWNANIFSRKGLVPASKARIKDAIRFVRQQHATGGTNTHEALRLAFERFKTMDTIYLLSDGSPTAGMIVAPELILYDMHLRNRLRGVMIHTIALHTGSAPSRALALQDDREDARRFMKMLAFETGGLFVQKP